VRFGDGSGAIHGGGGAQLYTVVERHWRWIKLLGQQGELLCSFYEWRRICEEDRASGQDMRTLQGPSC